MNERGFIRKENLRHLESSPQVLNLNKGVAMCERKGYCFLITTHHSLTLCPNRLKAMKPLILIFISILITLLSCDRPECTSTNQIFSNYSPSSPEYKKELIAQLQNADPNELSFWLDKYIEDSGREYLRFDIQGEGICAKGLMKVETWTEKMANIKRVQGRSYEGAEFKGLSFTVEKEGEEIELVYQGFDRMID